MIGMDRRMGGIPITRKQACHVTVVPRWIGWYMDLLWKETPVHSHGVCVYFYSLEKQVTQTHTHTHTTHIKMGQIQCTYMYMYIYICRYVQNAVYAVMKDARELHVVGCAYGTCMYIHTLCVV